MQANSLKDQIAALGAENRHLNAIIVWLTVSMQSRLQKITTGEAFNAAEQLSNEIGTAIIKINRQFHAAEIYSLVDREKGHRSNEPPRKGDKPWDDNDAFKLNELTLAKTKVILNKIMAILQQHYSQQSDADYKHMLGSLLKTAYENFPDLESQSQSEIHAILIPDEEIYHLLLQPEIIKEIKAQELKLESQRKLEQEQNQGMEKEKTRFLDLKAKAAESTAQILKAITPKNRSWRKSKINRETPASSTVKLGNKEMTSQTSSPSPAPAEKSEESEQPAPSSHRKKR